MRSQRQIHPCARCTSTRFAHMPAVFVLAPFVSVAREQVQKGHRADRRDARAGEALVCLACGHIDYFAPQPETLLQQDGVTEVVADGQGPYR